MEHMNRMGQKTNSLKAVSLIQELQMNATFSDTQKKNTEKCKKTLSKMITAGHIPTNGLLNV